jgi:hypothetical protein
MRLSVRMQAARHSVLVMCVAASQNPMQSSSVLPPPPGALGLCSLGLPGDSASELCLGTPLPESTFAGCCGESGAKGAIWGAGAPIAGVGGADGTDGAGGGCGMVVSCCCAADGARVAGAEAPGAVEKPGEVERDCACAMPESAASVKLAAMNVYRALEGWNRICAPSLYSYGPN